MGNRKMKTLLVVLGVSVSLVNWAWAAPFELKNGTKYAQEGDKTIITDIDDDSDTDTEIDTEMEKNNLDQLLETLDQLYLDYPTTLQYKKNSSLLIKVLIKQTIHPYTFLKNTSIVINEILKRTSSEVKKGGSVDHILYLININITTISLQLNYLKYCKIIYKNKPEYLTQIEQYESFYKKTLQRLKIQESFLKEPNPEILSLCELVIVCNFFNFLVDIMLCPVEIIHKQFLNFYDIFTTLQVSKGNEELKNLLINVITLAYDVFYKFEIGTAQRNATVQKLRTILLDQYYPYFNNNIDKYLHDVLIYDILQLHIQASINNDVEVADAFSEKTIEEVLKQRLDESMEIRHRSDISDSDGDIRPEKEEDDDDFFVLPPQLAEPVIPDCVLALDPVRVNEELFHAQYFGIQPFSGN